MPGSSKHKLPAGFKKLVNTLELTPPERQKVIFDSLIPEGEEFIKLVEHDLFHFEEFIHVKDLVLTEVIYLFEHEPHTLAVALYHCKDEALLNWFLKCMPHKIRVRFDEETKFLNQITIGEQKGARFRILEKARLLQTEGRFIIKPYSIS